MEQELRQRRLSSDAFGGRIGGNYFEYDFHRTKDDIDYDFDVTVMSVSSMLDWYPFMGGFRLSCGALYNGNEIDASSEVICNMKSEMPGILPTKPEA